MKRLCFVLAGLAVLAVHGQGPAQMGLDIDGSYEVRPELGPWLILTTTYPGADGKEMALKLVQALREDYHLHAYIYNRTDPERVQENERIHKIVEQQQKFLAENGLVVDEPLRVRRRRFQDDCGVFIGGYADEATARKELNRIKALKPPDPNRVPLASYGILNPIKKGVERAWVNPFQSAFVVPNPTVKREVKKEREFDAGLVKINQGEPFNLLNCPKRYTLAVVEFHGVPCVEPPSAAPGLLEKLGMRSSQALSAAALNAHNVAEMLRKLNFQAFVIHMRYYSIVTVGCYDSPDDKVLKAVQKQIGKLKIDPVPIMSPPLPIEIPPELRNCHG